MRPQLTLALLFVAVLAGCGSTPPSPESVVRAWSQELNTGDNEDAAKLFAPGAEIVQAGTTLRLDPQAEAQVRRAGTARDRNRSRAEREDRALAPDQHGARAGRPRGVGGEGRSVERTGLAAAPAKPPRPLKRHRKRRRSGPAV